MLDAHNPNGTNPRRGFLLLRSCLIFPLDRTGHLLHTMAPNGVNGAVYDDEDIDYSDIEAKYVARSRWVRGIF